MEDELITVTLRVKVPVDKVQALIDEWLHNSQILNIQTSNSDIEAVVTYVKEN